MARHHALRPLHPRLPDHRTHRRTAGLQAHGEARGARAGFDAARALQGLHRLPDQPRLEEARR
eukprot:13431001-Heterocapsa_arctica.AAC.1